MTHRSPISIASFASLGLALVACGGGGGDPATITPVTAGRSITETVDIATAITTGNASDAATGVLAIIALDQGILLPEGAAPAASKPAKPDAGAVAPEEFGTATCDASGCVFDHFGDEVSGYRWEIDGTISHTGDTLVFAVDMTIDQDPIHLHWRMDGALTITPTLLDGELEIVAEGTSGDAVVSWDVVVDYIDVVLGPIGCPVGGTIEAHSRFVADGHDVFDLEGRLTFGPRCGDVH